MMENKMDQRMEEQAAQGGAGPESTKRLPVLCGADIELGNFVLGLNRHGGTGDAASLALLREIEGLPLKESFRPGGCDCSICRQERSPRAKADGATGMKGGGPKMGLGGFNPQDWGRKFLPGNGGCAYIDLDHLELCLPEVLSAYDHVACWHAMLLIAREAMTKANEKLPDGKQIQVLVNNTDGKGNSYGSHLDFLVTRRAWNNIFLRKVHYMLYLASFQVSSIVITGQGKVGSENGAPAVAFQLSQRADFFETLMAQQTTFNRPIVNSRDEPLCGRRRSRGGEDEEDNGTRGLARLHVIFFDNTLCHVASLLKVGLMQIVLAMIEAERVNPELMLDDPVEAVARWSHDPTLQARARLVGGREVTAVELQMLFLEEAKQFVAQGGCRGTVPRAEEIVALWEDTLLKLRAGDLASLAPRLDWVLKLSVLQQVMAKRPDLDWDSPQVKHLDHMYASLDEAEGIYWAYEKSGFVERVTPEERVNHFVRHAPEDTRAWTRAALLSSIEPQVVDDVNWDFIRFKYRDENNRLIKRTLDLADPLGLTREETEAVFEEAGSLHELLDALGAPPEDKAPVLARPSLLASANVGSKALASLFGNQLTAWRGAASAGRNGGNCPSPAADDDEGDEASEDDEETIDELEDEN
jgi:proteasome accessory factor A